ncbi:hypothetical protein PHYBLDRAFT_145132 [Phycomyces blakesleeanus NRRL 1555(-)]|uniref:Uncharacterized protein n=2 Tax=Phycomyces blakesleeanus TaxID=4837 RepID=A0A162PKF6_PHYB8|nr:hypothetical protein PHYBLDRAFT_145132 [Phycomyces blakesleeanus NRRL 1555(-)]OAD73657.1 hypothetical protein PHYBLDRAFT_145132 [Phycomyces blakesleeanus NRRL 1555(-)]|eukprot:XP_018291697.1 hypothetical protein PHYBLDRAFT_145132 [Phycomyces blakesleeanus NRRL 1555(-)]
MSAMIQSIVPRSSFRSQVITAQKSCIPKNFYSLFTLISAQDQTQTQAQDLHVLLEQADAHRAQIQAHLDLLANQPSPMDTRPVSAPAPILLHDLPVRQTYEWVPSEKLMSLLPSLQHTLFSQTFTEDEKRSLLDQYPPISGVKYSPPVTLPQATKVFHKEDFRAMILHVEAVNPAFSVAPPASNYTMQPDAFRKAIVHQTSAQKALRDARPASRLRFNRQSGGPSNGQQFFFSSRPTTKRWWTSRINFQSDLPTSPEPPIPSTPLPECLRKIQTEKITATIVAPFWPSSIWFLLLQSMAKAPPLLLTTKTIETMSPLTPYPLANTSLKRTLEDTLLSDDARKLFLDSLTDERPTNRIYARGQHLFIFWAIANEVSLLHFTATDMVNFFTSPEISVYNVNTFQTFRSAIRRLHRDPDSLSSDSRLVDLFKLLKRYVPPVAMSRPLIDLSSTFLFLASIPSHPSTSLFPLSRKTAFLLAMAAFLRPSDLHRVILSKRCINGQRRLHLVIEAPKETREGRRIIKSPIIHPHGSNQALCPVLAFFVLRDHPAAHSRPDDTVCLFRKTVPPG